MPSTNPSSRPLLQRLQRLPLAGKLALIAAVISLLSSLTIILISYQGSRQLLDDSAEYFTHSLIGQLARDASSPLVQNDMLSLQAVLNDLVSNPMILQAAIYNLDNKAIAEAGERRAGRSYTSSITFQDSLAGYAVITIDQTPLQQKARRLGIQLLLVATVLTLLVWVVTRNQAQSISVLLIQLSALIRAGSTSKMSSNSISYRGDDELRQLAHDIVNGPSHRIPTSAAVLHIDFAFFDAIETLHRCYRQLQTICKLYDGTVLVSRADGLSAIFDAQSIDDNSAFRAICAGFLLSELCKDGDYPEFGIGVSLLSTSQTASEFDKELALQQAIHEAREASRTGNNGLYCHHATYRHPSVRQRISAEDMENHYGVTGFAAPYRALIERQLEALRSNAGSS